MVLQEADLEVGGEGTHGHSPAGLSRRHDSLQDHPVRVHHPIVGSRAACQAEGPLAEGDDGIELRFEVHPSGVTDDEGGAVRSLQAGEVDEGGRDVHTHHRESTSGQLVGVATGPAADVQDPLARPQAQRGHDGVDLMDRAVGERVTQVGGTQVVGHLLEPVVPAPFDHLASLSPWRRPRWCRPPPPRPTPPAARRRRSSRPGPWPRPRRARPAAPPG